VAAGWLLVYLAAFLGIPCAGDGGWGATVRLDYLWASLVRPDDFARVWVAGFDWAAAVERGVILGVAGAVLGVAVTAGWTCLRLLHVDRALSRLEMSLFSAAVGLNLVSLVTLGLGLAGWLRWEALLVVVILACAAAAALYFRAGCASGTQPIANETAGPGPLSRRWLWLAVPFVAAIVFSAMLPPGDFDVREYHLQAPKEFYQAGQITFLPHNVYANMPLGAEMLSLPAMVVLDDWWRGALVGKSLIALFAPLTALALYAAGCRFASTSAGVVAALVYISIPWVAAVSTQGLVEGAFGFYLFTALYGALIWKSLCCDTQSAERRTFWGVGLLVVAGFLSGGAVSTKYPGAVYSVLPLAVYVGYQAAVSRGRRQEPGGALRAAAKALCLFLLGAALGCGLWLAKNAVLSGNPTYPLLYEAFDGATRTPEKNVQWQRAHQPPNFEPRDLGRRAWTATVTSDWLSPLVCRWRRWRWRRGGAGAWRSWWEGIWPLCSRRGGC
jgi:hypothetical protein